MRQHQNSGLKLWIEKIRQDLASIISYPEILNRLSEAELISLHTVVKDDDRTGTFSYIGK